MEKSRNTDKANNNLDNNSLGNNNTRNTIIDILSEERVRKMVCKLKITPNDYLVYDFSKTHISNEEVDIYTDELIKKDLIRKIEMMWNGEKINYTEDRPVLHYLLREPSILDKVEEYISNKSNKIGEFDECFENTNSFKKNRTSECNKDCNKEYNKDCNKECNKECVDACTTIHTFSDNNVINTASNEIYRELIKMYKFCNKFKNYRGITGKQLDTIVSIGIGGSDLGPKMVTEALEYYAGKNKVYFVSNIDSTNMIRVFNKIDIEKTLFIVVSKTFTTAETINNMKLAMNMFKDKLKKLPNNNCVFNNDEIANLHFVAVSANTDEINKYKINKIFKMWDFVGGRYSLWSAVGLSIALYIGFKNYLRLLRGASVADADFRNNNIQSIAVRMAINELYYINNNYNNKCIVPYDGYLGLLYKYLQQAEMESNGKQGSKQMIVWGGLGTDVQHSFFQLLHQGEQNILTEFLLPIKNIHVSENTSTDVVDTIIKNHTYLISNCLAQSRSLMIGKYDSDPNKLIPGNKPSITILYSKLTPEILGALLAVYEHKIFIHGIFYEINSFDQFGVQLGKDVALELTKTILNNNGNENNKIDLSTNYLISEINKKD